MYTQEYLLQNPPKSIKDLSVWEYVVNKMSDNGSKKINIGGTIKYYQAKVNYLKNIQ